MIRDIAQTQPCCSACASHRKAPRASARRYPARLGDDSTVAEVYTGFDTPTGSCLYGLDALGNCLAAPGGIVSTISNPAPAIPGTAGNSTWLILLAAVAATFVIAQLFDGDGGGKRRR